VTSIGSGIVLLLIVLLFHEIESDEVRDHQHGHVEDRDDVHSAELPGQRGQTERDGVVVSDEEIGGSNEIEADDEEPEERTDRTVRSARRASTPVAKSPYAAKVAKPAGRLGPTTPGRMKTSPKKRKLCTVAMTRCASNRLIDLSLGRA
jgi:hypothetical protein